MHNADSFRSMNSNLHYNDSHIDRSHEDIYSTETASLWMSMVPIALSLVECILMLRNTTSNWRIFEIF